MEFTVEELKRRDRTGSGLLYLTALLWGSTFMFQKLLLGAGIPPFYMVALRFSFVLVTLVKIRPQNISRQTWVRGGFMGLLLFVAFVSQTIGLKTLDSSASAFLTSLLLVFVPIFSHLLDRSPISLVNALAILVALCGVYFFNLTDGMKFVWNIGTIVTLFCAVVFAVHLIVTARFVRLSSPMELNVVQNMVCALLGYTCAIFFAKEEFPRVWNPLSIGAIMYLGLIGSLLCYGLQSLGQKMVKSVIKVSLILSLEPIFAVLIGAPLLKEKIGPLQFSGMALIFAAVLLSEWQSSREHRQA